MYRPSIEPKLQKELKKLRKKNISLLEAVYNKMNEIVQNPHHYKPLRKPLQNQRRVHIGKYVLVFQINEAERTVEFLRFKHHDEAYI